MHNNKTACERSQTNGYIMMKILHINAVFQTMELYESNIIKIKNYMKILHDFVNPFLKSESGELEHYCRGKTHLFTSLFQKSHVCSVALLR